MPRYPTASLLLGAICTALSIGPSVAAPAYDSGLIPAPAVIMPDASEVRREVVLISDADGWSDVEAGLAESLRADGAIVVGIDLPAWIDALDASKGRAASTSSRTSRS